MIRGLKFSVKHASLTCRVNAPNMQCMLLARCKSRNRKLNTIVKDPARGGGETVTNAAGDCDARNDTRYEYEYEYKYE